MNKYKIAAALLLIAGVSQASLISRTYTYTDGNTISANENNTNENTIYNEFNGNINNANILDGGLATADYADSSVTTAKIADANVTTGKLSTTLQSTVTVVGQLQSYRRPVLKWISNSTIDVENNTATANQTCIHFPDERRCVTEDTSLTSVNRRFIITEAAAFSGTKNSGISGVLANGQWYALYAVKTTDVSTDFVIAGTTNAPVIANIAALNSVFGTNGWVYLGMIAYQDSTGSANQIAKFTQHGNFTVIRSSASSATLAINGIRLANSAGTASLTWTYASGFTTVQVPANIQLGVVAGIGTGVTTYAAQDPSQTYFAARVAGLTASNIVLSVTLPLADGVLFAASGSVAQSIVLQAFWDDALGVGFNPQL